MSFAEPSRRTRRGVPRGDAGIYARFIAAAAVLSDFDADQIAPARMGPTTSSDLDSDQTIIAAREHLRLNADPVGIDDQGRLRLSLREIPRREALRLLGDRASMQMALNVNTIRPNTVLQRMVEKIIEGQAIDIDNLTQESASALLLALRWFEGILSELPERMRVERALAHLDLTERIQKLCGDDVFVGREIHVEHLLNRIRRQKENFAQDRVPVLLHGPGGVGKSSISARVARDFMNQGSLTVFLDFDRTTLQPKKPISILTEILKQLTILLPHEGAGKLSELIGELSRWESKLVRSGAISAMRDLASFVARIAPDVNILLQEKDLLLVLDTFEEVQLHGSEVEYLIVGLLRKLLERISKLSVLMCGRAELIGRGMVDEMLLPDLAEEDAIILLQELVGFKSPKLEVIARELGGNPLVLRLAARLISSVGLSALESPSGMIDIRAAIRKQRLQSFLYGRILSHLSTENARRIAFPGLALRVITPELISEVLAEPCGLAQVSPEAAKVLYDEFAREVALVVEDSAIGGVRHRPDVRRLMLDTLSSFVDRETLTTINRGAVNYWMQRDNPVARAEEIYHRLRLAEPRSILDSRWREEAGPYLTDALEELPPRERIWLAERLGATVDGSLRRKADLADWKAQAARAAERHLQAGEPTRALATIRERRGSEVGGQLSLLEVQALRALGRLSEARLLAEGRSKICTADGDIDSAVRLLLIGSQLAESERQFDQAHQLATLAGESAASFQDRSLFLHALVARIRILRKLEGQAGNDLAASEHFGQEREELLRQAIRLATPSVLGSLSSEPDILREVVAELGDHSIDIVRMAVDALGLDAQSSPERNKLRLVLTELIAGEAEESAGDVAQHLSGMYSLQHSDNNSMIRLGGERVTSIVNEHLVLADEDSNIQRALTDYFRASVDTTISASWERARPGWDPDLAAALFPGLDETSRKAIGFAVGAGPSAVHSGGLPAVLNVRPDPVDWRDLLYEPGFVQLSEAYTPPYLPPVRNQGDLGSCTGQALAAVVDVLQARAAGAAQPAVSARMLYEMARHYDEMRIDGLDGSSLRGALKGLFHNGVCADSVEGAGYDPGDPRPFELTVEMARAARGISLSSYRRLRHVADHWHAALAETGAILASAVIHEGWGRGAVRQAGGRIPLAENPSPQGAHAFAVVGWTPEGFLVLNSEGPGWGGFRPAPGAAPLPGVAVWSYADWARHMLDGWVLRLAARAPDAFRLVGAYSTWSAEPSYATAPRMYILGHYVNLERGRLIEQGPYPSPAPSLQRTGDWLASPERAGSHPHLLLHFEDALDSRSAMASRTAWLVPLLKARGIYPIVMFWAEGFAEAVTTLLGGMAPTVQKQAGGVGLVADLMLEAEARRYLRPLWLDLRAQAKAMGDPARDAPAALAVLLALLGRRAEAGRPMTLNISAHGAGALALGAMAGQVAASGLPVRSLHLLSPLCCDTEATALAAALRPGLGAMLLGPPLAEARAERCGPYGGPLAQLLERSLEPEEGRGARQAIAALEAAVPGHAVLREGPGGQPLARGHAAMAESGTAWRLVAWRIAGAAGA